MLSILRARPSCLFVRPLCVFCVAYRCWYSNDPSSCHVKPGAAGAPGPVTSGCQQPHLFPSVCLQIFLPLCMPDREVWGGGECSNQQGQPTKNSNNSLIHKRKHKKLDAMGGVGQKRQEMSNDISILQKKMGRLWESIQTLRTELELDWSPVEGAREPGCLQQWVFCVQAEGWGANTHLLPSSKCPSFYSKYFFKGHFPLKFLSDTFCFTIKSVFPYLLLFKINSITQLWQTLLPTY